MATYQHHLGTSAQSLTGSIGTSPPWIVAIVTFMPASRNSKYGAVNSSPYTPVGLHELQFWSPSLLWLVTTMRAACPVSCGADMFVKHGASTGDDTVDDIAGLPMERLANASTKAISLARGQPRVNSEPHPEAGV